MANLIPEDKIPELARKPIKQQISDELYNLIDSMAQGFGTPPGGSKPALAKIGIEPSEDTGSSYTGAPNLASVKPFGFKKLLSTSHEQADVFQAAVKQMPKPEGALRSMFDLVTQKKPGYIKGKLLVEDTGVHPQGKLLDKLAENKLNKKIPYDSKPSTYLNSEEETLGALHKNAGTAEFQAWSKGMGTNMSHEHIHAQIQSLNKFHPAAGSGFLYRSNVEDMSKGLKDLLANKVHPIENLTTVRDILTDKDIRNQILPRGKQGYNDLWREAKEYWNKTAEKAAKYTKEDAIADGEWFKALIDKSRNGK